MTIGLPVVTGTESAGWLYSAMTWGALAKIDGVFTEPAKHADGDPRSRGAPELAERDGVLAERAGEPRPDPEPDPDIEPREPIAVLADVLERSGAEPPALEL